MTTCLQEQRVGDNCNDRGKGQRTCDNIFRTVKQNAQGKSALNIRIERNRAGAAAARHLVIGSSSRHFSSPEAVDPVFPIATSALRYYSTAPAA